MILFSIALKEIDRSQLPVSDQSKTGQDFEYAVIQHITSQYLNYHKPVAVTIDEGKVSVHELPESHNMVELFSAGKTDEGLALCDEILAIDPDNHDALYNSGMALSDRGEIDTALDRLMRAYYLQQSSNTATAIGVAYNRNKDNTKAKEWLIKASDLDATNQYASRNLAGLHVQEGSYGEALAILEPLSKDNPLDQSVLYLYGVALLGSGAMTEADAILKSTIELAPHTNFANLAKQQRSKIAEKKFRHDGAEPLRMDAVSYLKDAISTYDLASTQDQFAIFQEVAMVGMSGLDTQNPEQKYRLKTVPDKKFSGLHMTCYMWEGARRFLPEQDIGATPHII